MTLQARFPEQDSNLAKFRPIHINVDKAEVLKSRVANVGVWLGKTFPCYKNHISANM